MVEKLTVEKVVKCLNAKSEEHGNVGDQIKKVKVSDRLDSTDIANVKEFSTIFTKTFFDVKKQFEKDTALNTIVGDTKETAKLSKLKTKKVKRSESGLMSSILGLMVVVELIENYLKGIVEKIREYSELITPISAIIIKSRQRWSIWLNAAREYLSAKAIKLNEFLRKSDKISNFLDKIKIGDKLTKVGEIVTRFKTGFLRLMSNKWVAKLAGTFKLIFRLFGPLMAMFSFYESYKLFNSDDPYGGTLKFLLGVSYLFPGIGLPVTLLLEGLWYLWDVYKTKYPKQAKLTSNFQGGHGGILAQLTRVAIVVGMAISKTLKFLPFIGALFSFAYAYKLYSDGRWFHGSIELLAGIAALTGIGWPIQAALLGLSLLLDLNNFHQEQKSDFDKGLRTEKPFFTLLMKSISEYITEWWENGALKYFNIAFTHFANGDYFASLFALVFSVASIIPVISKAINWAYSVMGENTPFLKPKGLDSTKGDFWSNVWKEFTTKFKKKFDEFIDNAKKMATENVDWAFDRFGIMYDGIGDFFTGNLSKQMEADAEQHPYFKRKKRADDLKQRKLREEKRRLKRQKALDAKERKAKSYQDELDDEVRRKIDEMKSNSDKSGLNGDTRTGSYKTKLSTERQLRLQEMNTSVATNLDLIKENRIGNELLREVGKGIIALGAVAGIKEEHLPNPNVIMNQQQNSYTPTNIHSSRIPFGSIMA